MTINPAPAAQKKSSCLKYAMIGCLVVVVLGIVGSIGTYFGLKSFFGGLLDKYTDTQPAELPKVQLSQAELDAVAARITAFSDAMKAGQTPAPLELSGDELNGLLKTNPQVAQFADQVYLTIEGDQLKGQISLPLDQFQIPMTSGRYLNGAAAISASLVNGRLMVFLESLNVKGTDVPEDFMTQIRTKNLAEDAGNDAEMAQTISKLDSIEVSGGKMIIRAK